MLEKLVSSVHSRTRLAMFNFLCKIVPFHRHIHTISSTTPKLLLLQNHPWFSVRFVSGASEVNSFTVAYLVDICGFSPQQAASASKYVKFETRKKPDSVIQFFEKQGFSHAQALSLLRANPNLLRYDPDKMFLPKFEFFKSKGVSISDIFKIISAYPPILARRFDEQIIPSFDFFRSLFQSDDDKFIKTLKRYSRILVDLNGYVIPNIELLREEGVPELNIVNLLQRQPRSLTKKPDRFREIVKEVKEMGFNPLSYTFLTAVSVLTCMTKSTWARKASVYKRWGWTEDDILAAFVRHPSCMMLSEDSIAAKMDYFVHEMSCESSIFSRKPVMLLLSLDKRIIPRGSVIQVLLSKGLVKKLTLSTMFLSREGDFLKKFILCHEKEAGELLKLYQAKMDLAK